MTAIPILIVVLGILIFVHELGHFVVAKAVGVRVLKFSLGFGPSIFSFTRGETEYAICWVPLGGYVKMAGEDPEDIIEAEAEGREPQPGDFSYASVPRRLGIITAGPIMNIVLALVVYFGIFAVNGITEIATTVVSEVNPESLAADVGIERGDEIRAIDGVAVDTWGDAIDMITAGIGVMHTVDILRGNEGIQVELPSLLGSDGGLVDGAETGYGLFPLYGSRIATVVDTGVAAAAGMQAGDRITRIGDTPVDNWLDLRSALQSKAGVALEVTYEREGESITIPITPNAEVDEETGEIRGFLGVGPDPTDLPLEHVSLTMVQSVGAAASETWEKGTLIVDILARLVTGQISMKKSLGGPVMIASIARDSARAGLLSLMLFVAFISVNLGVLNLMPIPVLDGGHLVFLGAEAIRGKPLSLKFRLIATQVGMAFIILIMLYVTVNDFMRIF
ncbi:RIP metalloprotease RseP [Candidatus Zixiibacteriota bacterium]